MHVKAPEWTQRGIARSAAFEEYEYVARITPTKMLRDIKSGGRNLVSVRWTKKISKEWNALINE